MKKHIHYDVFVGIVLVALGMSLYPLTKKFPGTAGIFPQVILIALAALGVYTTIYGVIETKRDNQKRAAGEDVKPTFSWAQDRLPIIGYIIIVAYILLIKPVGFFVTTTVFMVAYMVFLRMRKPLVIGLVTIGLDAFLYVLFVVLLKLNLPSGFLI